MKLEKKNLIGDLDGYLKTLKLVNISNFKWGLIHSFEPIKLKDFDPEPLTFGRQNPPFELSLVPYVCMYGIMRNKIFT